MKVSRLVVLSLIIIWLVSGFSVQAQAALDVIGQGTSTHGTYNLIYDSDLDITWYGYANASGQGDYWQNQMDWAAGLSVTFGINTLTDWRLPVTYDNTCSGSGCTNSEMGDLYNNEGITAATPGDFANLLSGWYWSGTDAADPLNAWVFNMGSGSQVDTAQKGFHTAYALAVMDGMAVAPEPISSTLFILGGATLGFRRFMRRKLA